ncbi:MAG: hypothetical protein GYA34_15270, partial [Chloroflexi bacterium]|nr:hypothetical protein [Chloroflexota bacterium]
MLSSLVNSWVRKILPRLISPVIELPPLAGYIKVMFSPANLTQGQLYLVCGSRHFTGLRVRDLVVEYAMQGAVRVLVGGNRFGVHEIAYALAAKTAEYYDILENNISLAR